MSEKRPERDELLHRAREGDREALGELLERCRGFLKILAQRQLGTQMQARRGEDAIRLAWHLEQLPEHQREAIRLRHLEGYSLAEIANQMGRTPTAIAGLLKRGMQSLRKNLLDDTEK